MAVKVCVSAKYRYGLAVLCLTAPLAYALDLPDVFQDPLQTLPAVLDKGAVLPGDSTAFSCPIDKDYARPLLLAEAVDIALCNSPQVRGAWANIKIQAAALGTARAAYLPTIKATASPLNSNYQYPGSQLADVSTNAVTLYGNFTWRLFDFGGRAANLDAANWLLAQALANQDALFQKTLGGVVQAYFDAQTASAGLKAKIETERLAQSTLDSAHKRELKGVSGRGDTLQATTALAKAALGKSRAEGDLRKALSVLVYALGVPTNIGIMLPDTDTNAADPQNAQLEQSSQDLNAWLEETKKNHPAIVAAIAQLQAARKKIDSAQSEGLPTVDLMVNAYQNGYPGQGVSLTQTRVETIGLTVTVPLFEGFATTYKIRGAQAQAEQNEAQLADTENQTLMEVVKAYADATSSLHNLGYSATLLQAAEDALATSQRRYDKGAADILEILNTQTALADAAQERIRTLSEWSSARLRLLAASGVLGRSVVQGVDGGGL